MGAGLKRHQVPPAHLAHYPPVSGIDYEHLADPVFVGLAGGSSRTTISPFFSSFSLKKDETARGTVIAEAVGREVDVSQGILDQGREVSGSCTTPLLNACSLSELMAGTL